MVSFFKQRLLMILFLLMGVAACAFAIVWMSCAVIFSPDGKRAWRIAIAYDQLFNAATGGSEDETVSSRAGRERMLGTRWACVLCRVLDWLKKDHCDKSLGE